MKMLHVIARAFGLGAIALAVALTPACQSNEKLENQDAFKTQVDRIDRMEKDVDAMHRQMSTIDRDLQQVSTDVAKFSQQGGGDAQAAAAREQYPVAFGGGRGRDREITKIEARDRAITLVQDKATSL